MKLQLEIHGRLRHVEIDRTLNHGQWSVRVDGDLIEADAALLRPGVLSLLIGGQSWRIVIDETPGDPALHLGVHYLPWQVEDPRSLRRRGRFATGNGPVILRASMPGRVVRVLVEPAESVAAHQSVLVIEAMKMQNELRSPREGRIAEICVSPGETVASGQKLAVIE